MELDLHHQEILSSNITNPHCMRVCPPGKNKTQKVVIGDSSGTLHCFSVKKMALDTSFKSMPSNVATTCIELGLGAGQESKIFASEGQLVKGVTKKGKEFFRALMPGIDEDISSIRIHNLHVHYTGKQSAHLYANEEQLHDPYLSPTRITAFDTIPVEASNANAPMWQVLGTSDSKLQALKEGAVYYGAPVEGPVTALQYNKDSIDTLPGNKHAGRQEVIYGTQSGVVGQVFFDEQAIRRGWVITGKTMKPGPVTEVHTKADLTRDGVPEVVIAREGGDLEIYSRDDMGQMEHIAKHNVGCTIGSVQSGCITGGSATDELCVHTLRGQVLVVGTESVVDVAHGRRFRDAGSKVKGAMKMMHNLKRLVSTSGNGKAESGANEGEEEEEEEALDTAEQESRIKALTVEVQDLERRVQKAQAAVEGLKAANKDRLSQQVLSVAYSDVRLTLDESEGAFDLVVESPDGVSVLVLYCTTHIEVQDPGTEEGILSSGSAEGREGATFATLRCKGNSTRAPLRIRTLEGKGGTLQVFVVAGAEHKITQTWSLDIKPLCLHVPMDPADVDESRPFSEVRMSGSFSLLEMHNWISNAVQGVPRAPNGQTEAIVALRSCLVRSFVVCKYRQGACEVRSDNLAALAVMREALARQATAARQQVKMSASLHPAAARHLCQITWPRLEYLRNLEAKGRMADALKELQMMDGDISYLSAEHRQVLERAESIKEQLSLYPAELRYFKNMVKDLHVNYHRFQGGAVPRGAQQRLSTRLEDTSDLTLEELVNMIQADD